MWVSPIHCESLKYKRRAEGNPLIQHSAVSELANSLRLLSVVLRTDGTTIIVRSLCRLIDDTMPGIPAVPVENEAGSQRQLFGGSISCSFPARFQEAVTSLCLVHKGTFSTLQEDVSDIRDVPSNQEVFVDPNRDESIIVELLELKEDVNDQSSASWFLEDLASEQDAKDDLFVEAGGHLPVSQVPLMDPSTVVSSAVGTLAVSKAREGVEACNSVRVYLANMRLTSVQTDLLITVYQPLVISEHSSSAASVGVVGSTIPAEHGGYMSVPDIFSLILRTFKIEDWGLFG